MNDRWFVFLILSGIALAAFLFGIAACLFFVPCMEEPTTACWKGMGDDPLLYGITAYYNDTQMDAALREVASHAAHEHIYTLDKGYVCADSAVDVWDLLYMQGIRAEIVVGNKDEECTGWDCANHAWVVVPSTSCNCTHGWVVETTGGEIMRDDDPTVPAGYLSGMKFDTPKEMKIAAGVIKS